MCALDLVYLALRPRHALAGEDGRYLLLGESVALNGRGAANRANVVDLAKPDAVRAFEDDPIPSDGSGDLGDQIHRLAAHLVRRNVRFRFLLHSDSPSIKPYSSSRKRSLNALSSQWTLLLTIIFLRASVNGLREYSRK